MSRDYLKGGDGPEWSKCKTCFAFRRIVRSGRQLGVCHAFVSEVTNDNHLVRFSQRGCRNYFPANKPSVPEDFGPIGTVDQAVVLADKAEEFGMEILAYCLRKAPSMYKQVLHAKDTQLVIPF